MFALSKRVGRLADRFGPRLFMGLGPLIAAAGLALMLRIDADLDYVTDLLPGAAVFSLGLSADGRAADRDRPRRRRRVQRGHRLGHQQRDRARRRAARRRGHRRRRLRAVHLVRSTIGSPGRRSRRAGPRRRRAGAQGDARARAIPPRRARRSRAPCSPRRPTRSTSASASRRRSWRSAACSASPASATRAAPCAARTARAASSPASRSTRRASAPPLVEEPAPRCLVSLAKAACRPRPSARGSRPARAARLRRRACCPS